jgi:acyl-coenzyme A thioesterase PaaI-like protein
MAALGADLRHGVTLGGHDGERTPGLTAPRSLRELFEQLGLREVESDDGTFVMEMPVDERTTNTAGGCRAG